MPKATPTADRTNGTGTNIEDFMLSGSHWGCSQAPIGNELGSSQAQVGHPLGTSWALAGDELGRRARHLVCVHDVCSHCPPCPLQHRQPGPCRGSQQAVRAGQLPKDGHHCGRAAVQGEGRAGLGHVHKKSVASITRSHRSPAGLPPVAKTCSARIRCTRISTWGPLRWNTC